MNILKTFSMRNVLLSFSLGVFATAAHAQSALATAKVPFEFTAGGALLPQGDYTVEITDLSGVIVLRGTTGNPVALLTTLSGTARPATTAKLIFDRRGGMLYLSSVEWPSQTARVMSPFKPVTKGVVATALR
jgi:hypothetical protein